MAFNLPPISGPRALLADLRAFFATRKKHEWWAAAIAFLVPGWFVTAFALTGRDKEYIPPEVTFVQQWEEGRTVAEIRAQQKIDQEIKRLADAETEARRRKNMAEAAALKEQLDSIGM